jgi:hypothetical protein
LIIDDQFKINRLTLKNLFGKGHFMEDLTVYEKSLFLEEALSLFRYQARENILYRSYLAHLSVNPDSVLSLSQIPFLPIGFFKSHQIKTGAFEPEFIFESSGTTSSVNSKHYIKNVEAYLQNAEENFVEFYGRIEDYCILALLPSYLERNNSSLVCMAEYFIKKTGHPQSGFFLNDFESLHQTLLQLEETCQPTIMMGVTFALLDFAVAYPMNLQHTMVMETGGMKGRKKEMTRAELHGMLSEGFGVEHVHAEYGMTELLSQAYSDGKGIFHAPSTMRILLRSLDDPFEIWGNDEGIEQAGIINVIDLANRDSIAFIATDDLGRLVGDRGFEVIGRIDNSDIRGCSLLTVR